MSKLTEFVEDSDRFDRVVTYVGRGISVGGCIVAALRVAAKLAG